MNKVSKKEIFSGTIFTILMVVLGIIVFVGMIYILALLNKEKAVDNVTKQNEAMYVTAIMNEDLDLDKGRAIEIYKEATKLEKFPSVSDTIAPIDIEIAIGDDCDYEVKVYKKTIIYEEVEEAYRREYVFTIKYNKDWNIIGSVQ